MFELMFGGIWTGFIAIVTFIMLFADGPSLAEIWPVFLFLIPFWGIGIFMLYKGFKKVTQNLKTKKFGVERYAIIIDICGTGSYMNGRPELKAIMAVIDDDYGNIGTYEESIGFKSVEYAVGDFLLVSHYQTDVNIIRRVSESEIPYDKLEILQSRYKSISQSDNSSHYGSPRDVETIEEEVVIINGQKYVKK